MRSVRFLSVLTLAVLAAGCMTTGQMEPINLLSTEEEIEIGQQVAAQVEANETILDNAAIQAYVRGIGERLARVSTRQDVTYQFKVIDAPDTVNAFALPGGYMYIYTGLMKICDNEAELAGVMAHEMGHVAAHHHGEMLTRQFTYETLRNLLLGSDPGQRAQTAARIADGFFTLGVQMRYSRQQEYEADRLGTEFLFRAGYKPEAMVSFMDKMMAIEEARGGGPPLPIFSSHPPTTERRRSLVYLVNQYPADMRSGSPVYADRYQREVLRVLGDA